MKPYIQLSQMSLVRGILDAITELSNEEGNGKLMLDGDLSISVPGYKPVVPRQMDAVIEAANKIVDEFAKPPVFPTAPMSWSDWLASDDTGASSTFMLWACCLEANPACWARSNSIKDRPTPQDKADFSRCYRLVKFVLRDEFHPGKLESHGDKWAAIARSWDELCALYVLKDYKGLNFKLEVCNQQRNEASVPVA